MSIYIILFVAYQIESSKKKYLITNLFCIFKNGIPKELI